MAPLSRRTRAASYLAVAFATLLASGDLSAAPRRGGGARKADDLVAEAPDTANAALAEAARNTFLEGVRSYKKKRYQEALAAFLESYALSKSPTVLVNLGLTHLRLGNPAAAIRAFEQFLGEARGAPASVIARAEAGLVEAKSLVGHIAISAPEGAELSVDGAVVGHAPLKQPVDVAPGRHEVSMNTAGGTKTESIDVERGATLEIKLVPPRSAVRAPPPPPRTGDHEEARSPAWYAPPDVTAPTYAAGAISVVSLTAAFVLSGIRVNAERNASTATEALVRANKNPASCNDGRALAADPTIGDVCGTLRSAQNTLDQTRGPASITLWVGVGAAAASLGWFLLAPKSAQKSTGERPAAPSFAVGPLVAPGTTGIGASGSL